MDELGCGLKQKSGPHLRSAGAERISAVHRGSHEHDKRGGFAADPEAGPRSRRARRHDRQGAVRERLLPARGRTGWPRLAREARVGAFRGDRAYRRLAAEDAGAVALRR